MSTKASKRCGHRSARPALQARSARSCRAARPRKSAPRRPRRPHRPPARRRLVRNFATMAGAFSPSPIGRRLPWPCCAKAGTAVRISRACSFRFHACRTVSSISIFWRKGRGAASGRLDRSSSGSVTIALASTGSGCVSSGRLTVPRLSSRATSRSGWNAPKIFRSPMRRRRAARCFSIHRSARPASYPQSATSCSNARDRRVTSGQHALASQPGPLTPRHLP